MKVAYLGPNGTFSEEAAKQYFIEDEVEFFLLNTIPDVIEAVGDSTVDKAIVPLENTIEGTINMTIDSIINYTNVFIEGELILPVSLHLLTNKDINRNDIKEVWSISPILTQCRAYLRNLNVKSLQYDSSAAAAFSLKNSDRDDVAVIGSKSLAKLLNLTIIDHNIQDNLDNETRFVIISNECPINPFAAKTLFVVTPDQDQPGVLSAILNIFSALSINLSWIESRPTTKKIGVYRFFLESNNNCSELLINKAITILDTLGHDVRIIGRYDTNLSK
ncbi:MAG: prephenate dehydratase [Candidatus Pristimantibacillus lignocellulolyticus]|uniref:Prephenate dehydratase n=1 Tax=Candidatus Pristimantibacillus lignocellulolyticus TaxID=2994561 RepID=A0A9J6ZCD1_9BACL|nr:MAG: prephenate dehydratase [Candidatus Pristimantibacillus lignocellulolyticus]